MCVLTLLFPLPVFGFVCDAVARRHRPAAVGPEDSLRAVPRRAHRLWRRSKSGPACQQCVHLFLSSRMRTWFFLGFFFKLGDYF